MARVTVEDCLKNVKNRFELVMLSAKRARQLMRGKEPHVPWDNDKATVVALREIAAGYVDFDKPDIRIEQEESPSAIEQAASSLAKSEISENEKTSLSGEDKE